LEVVVPKRALDLWNRKVAMLPRDGVAWICTDLQGNLRDYQRVKALAQRDEVMLFLGDLVHGPDAETLAAWPAYLGAAYRDESRALLLDFELASQHRPMLSLMGNHEHAHVGGPRVAKFYMDEAAVLDASLGAERARMHAFLKTFPLLAVGDGVVFVHGAPAATEASLEAFEALDYGGYASLTVQSMFGLDTLAELLWSRCASTDAALDLLEVCTGRREGVVVFGHDVVRSGWAAEDDHQLCISSSFGCFDPAKTLLRLDLGRRVRSVSDLEPALVRMYPGPG
jgi:hypothetical protein